MKLSIPLFIVVFFFLIGGVSHFIALEEFVKIMPNYLGYHEELVIISGAFELLGAIGLLFQKSREIAGYGLIALSVAVFPANLNMALNPELFPDVPVILLYIRLPLQLLIIWFIWVSINPKKPFKSNKQQST